MEDYRIGFRILGSLSSERSWTIWPTAFNAYASCDFRAKVESEAYLSAFTFGSDFKDHLETTGSTRNYQGKCFAPWLWIDIDRPQITDALLDARKLASWIIQQYRCDAPLTFFSGCKGFHLGLASSLFNPEPTASFHCYAKKFACSIASRASVQIDQSVYDKVRAFRAPNSKHPRSGLYKRILSHDELMRLKIEQIKELAKSPEPFEIPPPQDKSADCCKDWAEVCQTVDAAVGTEKTIRKDRDSRTALYRSTLDFIREGALEGHRANELFKAAANLSESGCPLPLVHDLLSEAARDSGLKPSEIARQIECGFKHAERNNNE